MYSAGPLPDLDVRAAQLYLTLKGFTPNGIDGIQGLHTAGAISNFQASVGLPQSGALDAATMTALTPTAP
jgi:peptidoglycan hydrolase-like protein with peptidoglycan-binding domain